MTDELMDREFAILIVNACYRACREIGEIGVMITEFAPDENRRQIKMQSGAAIAEIGKITGDDIQDSPRSGGICRKPDRQIRACLIAGAV